MHARPRREETSSAAARRLRACLPACLLHHPPPCNIIPHRRRRRRDISHPKILCTLCLLRGLVDSYSSSHGRPRNLAVARTRSPICIYIGGGAARAQENVNSSQAAASDERARACNYLHIVSMGEFLPLNVEHLVCIVKGLFQNGPLQSTDSVRRAAQCSRRSVGCASPIG